MGHNGVAKLHQTNKLFMTKIAQTTVAKALVAFVAAAMIFTMFAAPAKAQTSVEDLQKMINDLMVQIAALQGATGTTTGGNCAAIPAPLTIGAQNANVTALQNYLIANGQTIPAGATGYFGTQTQSALAAWQAANGVSPAVGYYGPITAAAMAAKCTPDTNGGTTGGSVSLDGGEGSITVTDLLSSAVDIDLGKADEVLSVEVEAVDSDVSISRVDFEFNARPWLYFDEVNLWIDGEEVASLSGSSDFSEVGSNWRARFSGLDAVIMEDDTVDITLEVVVHSALAGTRANDTVNVAMTTSGMRFMDGAGITETDGIAINANVTFNDVFTDGSITSTVSESSPENATVVVEASSRTNGVEVAVIDAKAKDADMMVKTVTAQLTVAGTGNTTGNVFYRAYLMNGSTELKRVSVSGSTAGPQTLTFSDVDFEIMEDDTEELSLVVDFNRANDMGTTTSATFTVGNIVITSENPNFASDTSTTNVNETHKIIKDGLVADVADITVTKNNNVTTVTYEFDVTAYGADFWISATSADAVTRTFSSAASTTLTAAPTIDVSGVTVNGSNNFRIVEGQTRTVTATYSWTNAGTDLQYITGQLDLLRYKTTASDVLVAGDETVTLGATDFKLPNNVSVNPQQN